VVDDGVGFDPDRPVPPRAATDGHGGLGLANVHQRLVAMFGADAGLRIRSRAGRGTAVLTRVPATVAPRPSGGGQGGAAPC
jgi:sensor histidine kinase YesM